MHAAIVAAAGSETTTETGLAESNVGYPLQHVAGARRFPAMANDEATAQTIPPGIKEDSIRQNNQIILLGLILDEQRRTNSLLEQLVQKSN